MLIFGLPSDNLYAAHILTSAAYTDPDRGVACIALCYQGILRDLIAFFYRHFYFPAQLVGGFTLGDLLDKPWSQVSSILPPGTCLQFLSRIGFGIPTARRFLSNVSNSRSRAFR